MICHQKKCIFIHIPKVAGQSMEHIFLNLLGLNWKTRAPLLLRYNDVPELGPPRLAHLKAAEYVKYKYLTQRQFDEYFKFSFVRNPWDRMISIYKHLGFSMLYDFKTFLMTEFKTNIWHTKSWFVCPQSDFLYNEDNKLLVDFVGRFEKLKDDFNLVCRQIGLPPTDLPHVNSSDSRRNRDTAGNLIGIAKNALLKTMGLRFPIHSTYHDYYDNESKEFVGTLYEKDIRIFGYMFDESHYSK